MSRIDDIKASTAHKRVVDLNEWQNERNDLLKTFGTDHGKRVLVRMLTKASFFRTSNTGNSGTYALEGARGFMLDLQGFIPELMGEVIAIRYRQEEERIKRELVEQTKG